VSYDIRWCVETVMPNNDGERFCAVRTPEYDSPTYNYRKMFVACMGWDYSQSECDEDGNWHTCYYPMTDVIPKLERGLKELQEHPERFRKYEPKNGWGTLSGAIKCIKSWLNELDGEDNWDAITNEWPIEALWWRW
jgi:hypothetical protein